MIYTSSIKHKLQQAVRGLLFQANHKCNIMNQIGVEERIIKDDPKQGEQKIYISFFSNA